MPRAGPTDGFLTALIIAKFLIHNWHFFSMSVIVLLY
jgi:hypothetical protein